MKLGATHPPPLLSHPQHLFFINTQVWLYNGARSRNSLHVSPVRSGPGVESLHWSAARPLCSGTCLTFFFFRFLGLIGEGAQNKVAHTRLGAP